MDTMTAFIMGSASRGKEEMVFDWEKAARIIVERRAQSASAGLAGDWDYTRGSILSDGKPVPKDDTYVFLASTWATPQLEVDGETLDCYRMQSEAPGWNSGTYWPPEALAIINVQDVDCEVIPPKRLPR